MNNMKIKKKTPVSKSFPKIFYSRKIIYVNVSFVFGQNISTLDFLLTKSGIFFTEIEIMFINIRDIGIAR